MKTNKSLKTVALWVFLIVIFFAIYQTVSKSASGRRINFSQFINQALPPTDGTGTTLGPIVEVVVRGEYVEYRERSGAAAPADPLGAGDGALRFTGADAWRHTRGDVSMPLGGPGSPSVLAALAQRGVRVRYEKPAGAETQLQGAPADFSEFLARVGQARPPTNVAELTIHGKEITGTLRTGERFVTVGDLSGYRKELVARDIQITEEAEGEGSLWLSIIGTWLPMIIIFLIFFLFMRQLQSGGGRAMSFGKSRHKLLNESTNRVTFNDIAGIEEAKDELQEIIAFLKDPKKFTRLGGRIPKGVLLMGPPGTGKTLLARGVAGEAGVPFFSISGSDFVEMFVGVGASRVRDLFEQGKKNAPCIIFIDEIDAVGRHRGAGMGGGHDEREQTLNQLLVEMDGFESNEGVILVAATNRPDVLDPALMRPGRFDRRVVVPRPDLKGRAEILVVHTRKTKLAKDVDLKVIARGTPGFAGADLENLVNEAALWAARHDKDFVEMVDFEAAKDKVMMGAERRSAVLTDDEKRITAYHEAGHALVAAKIEGNDPLHKVTIIPRGMALGLTWTLPEADQHTYSEQQVLAKITMAMGGRVAEELVFNRLTTGAGNDIEQATKLARKMVCEWGMSRLGPIALSRPEGGGPFLGRDFSRSADFSEQTQAEADTEIKRIIMSQYERAQETVRAHREDLEAITQALLEFESIDGREVMLLLSGTTVDDLRDQRANATVGSVVASAPGARASRDASSDSGKSGDILPPDLDGAVGARQRLPDLD